MIRRHHMKRRSDKTQATYYVLARESQKVIARAKGLCECRCGRLGRDVHHVVKRSQGGRHDADTNLIYLSRFCHERTDWPYSKGRLAIVNIGSGRFDCRLVYAEEQRAWSCVDPAAEA